MKLKGIWVAIAAICVAGIGVTNYSVRHLSAGENEYVQEISESSESEQTETTTSKKEAVVQAQSAQEPQEQAQALPESMQKEASSETVSESSGETWVPENGKPETGSETRSGQAQVPELQKPPETGKTGQAQALGEELSAAESTQPEKSGIMTQLAKLDEQTQERREASADGNANAMKASAESERKIWENKLQGILELLEQQLSGEEKDTFFAEQRSWVRDRESTAVSNSKRQNGSALEELEYIRSLRDITRERVYELAERYETILDGKRE